jgi:hypothetical protein
MDKLTEELAQWLRENRENIDCFDENCAIGADCYKCQAPRILEFLHSKGLRKVEAAKIPKNSYPLKEDYENDLMAIGFERALVRLKSTNPNGLYTEGK